MVKQSFRLILHGSLGVLASLYLIGCQSSTLPPSSQQFYEVSGAKVCDYQNVTPTIQDDCDRGGAGYYYNPGTSVIFYRSTSGRPVIVQRNVPRSSIKVGGTLPMSQPVITNRSGTPILTETGSVVRSTSKSSSVTTAPVRSTASFEAPGIGRVTAGKSSIGGTSRGMRFGGSGGRGFGG